MEENLNGTNTRQHVYSANVVAVLSLRDGDYCKNISICEGFVLINWSDFFNPDTGRQI